MIVKNIKHGTNYRVISPYIINSTNEQNGQKMVSYISTEPDTDKPLYVKEINEFIEKFNRLDGTLFKNINEFLKEFDQW